MARILPIAAKHGVPVTFRAAGTSLSGQAVTDSVLLKLSHTGNNFRRFSIPVSRAVCRKLGRRRLRVGVCCLLQTFVLLQGALTFHSLRLVIIRPLGGCQELRGDPLIHMSDGCCRSLLTR